MLYDIRQVTEYSYASPVPFARQVLRLLPVDRPGQRVVACELSIRPQPTERHDTRDFFGNWLTTVAFSFPHSELRLETRARVLVEATEAPLPMLSPPFVSIRRNAVAESDLGPLSPVHFLFPSRLVALVEEIARAVARGDRRAYFTANQAFHLAIVTAARNATLADAHRILNLRLYRTRYLAIMDLENWTEQAAEHPKLLDVLRARDGDAMEAMVKQHMLRAWEFIEKSGVVAPPAEPERAAVGPAGRARVEG